MRADDDGTSSPDKELTHNSAESVRSQMPSAARDHNTKLESVRIIGLDIAPLAPEEVGDIPSPMAMHFRPPQA